MAQGLQDSEERGRKGLFLCLRAREEVSARRLENLLKPVVEDLGYEWVGLEYSSNPKNKVLLIYIDQDDGISVSDCERVSREVAATLDVEDPIPGQYNLQVSSPGLDRPLFTPSQFEQFAGEQAQVSLFAPQDGQRRFKGRILRAEDEMIYMEYEGAELALEMGNIAKARLVPDYDRILAGRE